MCLTALVHAPPVARLAGVAARVIAQQDTAIPVNRMDTAVVETPLPRGVGQVVRSIFNQPPWLQVTVVVVGVLLGLAIVAWLVWHRKRLIAWASARSVGGKIALAAAAVLVLTGAVGFSMVSWNYTQHNNDFCIGCHVMGPAWTRFQHSEHRKLKCHDCHQQSIFASMRQLYFWVAERPEKIPPHAKVPTRVCQNCHNQSNPDSTWKNILATAGHSVHLRNDTSALKNVQCVTCHGAEVHHFVPVDKTCGQSNCHENIQIQLGKMAGQTSLHCTGCHPFTTQVADNITPDSARVSLVPANDECLGCHQMKQKLRAQLVSLDPETEPHHAVCGTCHDPHKQKTTRAAFESCAKSGCHTRADTLTPFHRGLSHNALANCGTCHQAHVWKVKSTECTACHREGGRLPSGAGHVIAQAGTAGASPHGPSASDESSDPSVSDAPWQQPASVVPTPPPQDTTHFSHARHKNLACTTCHSAKREHGELMVSKPAGCLECHHGPAQKASCTTCHTKQLPSADKTVAITATVWSGERTRTLAFDHTRHQQLQCRSCHTAAATLAVERTCTSCHAQHHGQDASCQSCHPAAPIGTQTAAHPRQTIHTAECGGAGCHQDSAVPALTGTRNVCVACHREQVNHKPGGDCASCHLVSWHPTVAATARAADAIGGGHKP